MKLWQEVVVTTDALPGRTFTAKVSRIAAVADSVTRNFDVEVEIPNPDRLWKPGMIASVELKAGGRPRRRSPCCRSPPSSQRPRARSSSR